MPGKGCKNAKWRKWQLEEKEIMAYRWKENYFWKSKADHRKRKDFETLTSSLFLTVQDVTQGSSLWQTNISIN
jgi:hypothetical protein